MRAVPDRLPSRGGHPCRDRIRTPVVASFPLRVSGSNEPPHSYQRKPRRVSEMPERGRGVGSIANVSSRGARPSDLPRRSPVASRLDEKNAKILSAV
jgi:hypothetical protein